MKKVFAIILSALLIVQLFVSCNSDGSVDEAFNCTITFNGNGATEGEMSAQTVGRGVGTRLNTNTFGRFCFIFIGWDTEADGTGTPYSDNQNISFTESTTLYAQCELNPLILSEEMTSWVDGGYYLLNNDVSFEERITVSGDVTLILADGYKLTASRGISVNEGNNLTIVAGGEGTGILEATGIGYEAGVGGDDEHNSGTITINGGTVNVSSTYYGAGIGGGCNGSGTVVINGGIVTVTNEDWGAGIGGGCQGSGTITINGGTVNVTSTRWGAGIGGGCQGSGTITINGGTVTSGGKYYAAGIGGGSEGNGTVIINGGTVNASAEGAGAGIGGGTEGSGTITINGGTVNASAKSGGAGIGGGRSSSGRSIGNVTVNGGRVIASAVNGGAGIGGGQQGSCGTIIINDGTVEASAENGAGIGGGFSEAGGTVTINGGIVKASSDSGVGIGMGYDGYDNGTLTLGKGVVLEVSTDNANWSDYNGETRDRYMRTK